MRIQVGQRECLSSTNGPGSLSTSSPAAQNLYKQIDRVGQGVRTVQHVVGAAATLVSCRKRHKKSCQLHLEVTYYSVGSIEYGVV